SGDTDQIDLSETGAGSSATGDPRQASGTGISVFDADEVEPADPLAKTQVPKPSDEDEVALESVASGSGLLDLTRESDDTSLGAELLEEIYPGSEESDSKIDSLAGSGSATGIGPFETAMGLEASAAAATGIAMDGVNAVAAGDGVLAAVAYEEPYDAAADGMSIGLLLAAVIALLIALVVGISALFGVTSGITTVFSNNFWIYVGVLLGGSIVFGLVGHVVGRQLLK
ncbi:MAG: hypothetical protein QGG09_02680, partial [Pirellulaceae bacterium]|nr:hypothetical protein [Pirellulaceae bacterium]